MNTVNKVALITGSSSGIGLSCAHVLAKRGVNVIMTGSRDKTLVCDTVADMMRYGVRVDYVSADLSKLSGIETLCSEVTRLYPDGVDILVNNAGWGYRCQIEDYPDDKWDSLMTLNLTAPFKLTKHCLPAMKKKGWGRIVNVSSSLGLVGAPMFTAYSATKHALIGLTKGVALETGADGITCNAVCPGCTRTRPIIMRCEEVAIAKGISCQDAEEMLMSTSPIKKMAEADQVAELVEFLCLSNASSQMTGATYLIDNGYVAQ